MSTLMQRSFAGGELAPSLYARIDTIKYQTGLRQCRNMYVMRSGGVTNRPGTQYVGEVKDSDSAVRLIPFIFNSSQAYVLEFGDLYMRIIQNGVYLSEAGKTVTGITKASPGVVTAPAHGFAAGEEVSFTGLSGMDQLLGRNFKVGTVTTNTFALLQMDGVSALDTTAFTTYVSGGLVSRVYTVTTLYTESEVPNIKFTQSADVMTFAHPNHPPQELRRQAALTWTFTQMSFSPDILRPTSTIPTGGTGGGETRYKVTGVRASGEESLPGVPVGINISNSGYVYSSTATLTTTAAHNLVDGDEIYIGTSRQIELADNVFTVQVMSSTVVTLKDPYTGDYIDSTNFAPLVFLGPGAFGKLYTNYAHVANQATGGSPVTITWNPGDNTEAYYNIYKRSGGKYGFIGTSTVGSFVDAGLTPNVADQAPTARNPFIGPGNYPSCVSYIQQRLAFANTTNRPETSWLSQIARYHNFTYGSPLLDDDAVTFTLAGRQINEIKDLLDLGQPFYFTTAGEWSVGADGQAITPTQINLKQQSYNGSSFLNPIVVDSNALYVQARGTIVRDLRYDYQVDGYRGTDLTVFSSHLFDKYAILDWTYQQVPHSTIWAVRDDGTLLGCTYVREHDIVGWHRHDFEGGIVENVCSIPEGNEDALYLVIKRTTGGDIAVEKRYIERFTTKRYESIEDAVFMDSSLSYDGRNTNESNLLDITSAGGWTHNDTVTVTVNTSTFVAGDVGNSVFVTAPDDGTQIRITITGYTSGTVVTGNPNRNVPESLQGVQVSEWSKAVDTLSGLWHLNDKDVAVFADGFVVANPNNASYVVRTVTDGTLTLDRPYSVIHVGLPITADVETLDIDTAQGETIVDKKKIVSRVTLQVEATRGVWIGGKPPEDDDVDPLEGLSELQIRENESYDDPVRLATEAVSVNIEPGWSNGGRVFIRQVDPLPLSILSIAPSGMFPFRGGA